MTDTLTIPTVGPADHGTRMSLEEFARARGEPGCSYELEEGVITVVEIPGLPHGFVVQAVRNSLTAYQLAYPDQVCYLAGSNNAALRLPGMQSERHPDLAVYLNPPPVEGDQPWDFWCPDIVIEVVSKSSEDRDYRIKRKEYLQAGVRLYWIVDPQKRAVTVLTRRGDAWSEQQLNDTGKLATNLLPGFELAVADVFKASSRTQEDRDS
jgi:Uma2 family endonuclease